MTCRKCGSRLYCKDSRESKRFPGKTRRMYTCKNCHEYLTTIETEEVDYVHRNHPDKELEAQVQRLRKELLNMQCKLYKIKQLAGGEDT